MVRNSSGKKFSCDMYYNSLLSLTLCRRGGNLTVVEVAVPGCWLERLLRTSASQTTGAV